MKIAVVIPAYKVVDSIKDVILSIPENVDHIIVVDDNCPFFSGKEAEKLKKDKISILYHTRNTGVGGAVVTGFKKAMELGCDIFVKIDGDGQMDAKHIDCLITPIIKGEADYTKGNRFMDFKALKSMPKIRLFGNSILSFLLKVVSGYWNIMDPTNGYTAIREKTLEKIVLDKLSKRYFFESDMLINMNIINAVVKDVNIPARYGNEKSSLSITKIIFHFPQKLMKGFMKRIFLKYFLYDFNMASVYILLGMPMFIFGTIFGIIEWLDSAINETTKPAGTIMLVALPIIVSFQMLLQAINIDINSVPKRERQRE